MSFDINKFDNVSSGATGGPRMWSYGSSSDNLATMLGSGYFDEVKFRIEADDMIYVAASDGVEFLKVTSQNGQTATTTTYIPASGGAPNTAAYIVQTPNAELPNEQALSTLATGIVKNTTTTGVLSIATQGVDYYAPGGVDVAVVDGGTGVSTMTTAYAPVCAGTTATGPLQVASTGMSTAGFLLTSNGSAALPSWQAAPAGGMTWANISGTSQAAAINTGYIVGNASATTITLPATAPVGSVVAVQGKGAAGWVLTANSGQTIQVGQTASSTAGTVTSAAAFDAIQVVCVTANTTWTTSYVLSSGVTVV